MQVWHLLSRTFAKDCFCNAHTPLTVTYPFCFISSTFLIISYYSEAFAERCSIKKVFLEISQNSLENTYSRVSFLKSCRPLVAAASLLFNNIFLIADFQNLFYMTMERNSTIQYLNVYLKFTDVKPFRITQYYPMEIDCVKEWREQ